MSKSNHVDIGFFEDFKQANTLLVSCEDAVLSLLLETIDSLASGKTDSVAMHDLPFVRAHNVTLVAATTNEDQGIFREGFSFTWYRSVAGWKQVRMQVADLLRAHKAHLFLDGPDDEVTVQLSVGEYSSSFWLRDG